ncbi:hypothetical protein HWV62_11091 [Athelia sp. TMB]|nr:hypothetical protein HWV62_11091 [Athelia sp. TMB]
MIWAASKIMDIQAICAGPLMKTPNHLAIRDGPGVKAVWVEPASEKLITGSIATWASVAKVEGCRLPGYWIDKAGADIPINQKPVPGEKVVYCLHGVVDRVLTPPPSSSSADIPANIPRGILQYCKPIQRAFSIEYRLSSTTPYAESGPFPTAIIDALAGYIYLVHTVGFSPSDIIIEGDSAGGNLALALTRYLVEHVGHPGLPAPPGGMILLSPWTDLGFSHDGPTKSLDMLTMDYLGSLNSMRGIWSRHAYVGPHGMGAAMNNVYISPASLAPGAAAASFKGFPKTFINVGGAERLYDMIMTLKERMTRDLGEEQVTLYEAPDAVHDYICMEWHEPERSLTLQAIAEWL